MTFSQLDLVLLALTASAGNVHDDLKLPEDHLHSSQQTGHHMLFQYHEVWSFYPRMSGV